jgi:hypothetical protein
VTERLVALREIQPVWLFGRPGSLTFSHLPCRPRTGSADGPSVSGARAGTTWSTADLALGLDRALCAASSVTTSWLGRIAGGAAVGDADAALDHAIPTTARAARSAASGRRRRPLVLAESIVSR